MWFDDDGQTLWEWEELIAVLNPRKGKDERVIIKWKGPYQNTVEPPDDFPEEYLEPLRIIAETEEPMLKKKIKLN